MKKEYSISMGTAALISGLVLFIPTAPYAEFYVFKKLIVFNNATQTTQNLLENSKLFLTGIYAMLFTLLYDVVLAWALYIFLKPVNASLSALAGVLRIVYAILAIVALFNFIIAYQIVNHPSSVEAFNSELVMRLVNARGYEMNLAYQFLGIYLILIGILIYKATYIPKVMGILMAVTGLAYIIINLQPYFFENYNLSWVMIFFFGELIFTIWLLVKGTRVKESELTA